MSHRPSHRSLIRRMLKGERRTEENRRRAQRSADRQADLMALSRRRIEERLNRWRKAFPRWLPLPWTTAGRLASRGANQATRPTHNAVGSRCRM